MEFRNNVILIWIIAVTTIILLSTCAKNSNYKKSVSTKISNEIEIDNINTNDTIYYSDLFESYKIIPLETNEECLIGQISSIRFCQDKIVILDQSYSKSVFLFELDGRFIRKIGKLGKGPGEFISPHSISTNDEKGEIVIYDGMLNRIQFFSITGEYLKSIQLKQKIGAKSIELFDNKIFISNHVHESSDYFLYAIDFKGNVIGRWLPNNYPKGFMDNNLFSPYNIFLRTNHDLKHRTWLLNSIYCFENNTLQPFITLKSSNMLTLDDLEKINKNKTNTEGFASFFQNRKFTGISSYSEASNLSIIEYINNNKRYMLFYNHGTRKLKCTEFLNFRDDMTHFTIKRSGYFFTTYENNMIAQVGGLLINQFLENVNTGKIESDKQDFTKITLDSNPCIIMYKLKEKNLFNE